MYRYLATANETKPFETSNDAEKLLFMRRASKYLFIYSTHHDVFLINFVTKKYNDIYDTEFISEINQMFRRCIKYLDDEHDRPLAIVLSDTHLNVVQFLFPFAYAGHINEIRDRFRLVLIPREYVHMDVIHLGDYAISQVSRIYKEKTEIFFPLNKLMTYLLKQLNRRGVFLAGNHDFFIHKDFRLLHHTIYKYGDKTYLFIHGPPVRLDLPDKQYQFKDRTFFRYDRKKSIEWNREQIDKCFADFKTRIIGGFDVIVCGHENMIVTIHMPDEINRGLVQYELIENDLICLDAMSSTRAYFSFESSEIDHPYIDIESFKPPRTLHEFGHKR